MGSQILYLYSLTVDSTEQPIERPSDREEAKKFFSQKQKNHTQNQFIVLQKAKT